MKSHKLFVPWMFLSLFVPVSFFMNLFINILFFNVVGVAYLLVVSGLPSLVTLYAIYCVYCLYKEMYIEDQLAQAAQQVNWLKSNPYVAQLKTERTVFPGKVFIGLNRENDLYMGGL